MEYPMITRAAAATAGTPPAGIGQQNGPAGEPFGALIEALLAQLQESAGAQPQPIFSGPIGPQTEDGDEKPDENSLCAAMETLAALLAGPQVPPVTAPAATADASGPAALAPAATADTPAPLAALAAALSPMAQEVRPPDAQPRPREGPARDVTSVFYRQEPAAQTAPHKAADPEALVLENSLQNTVQTVRRQLAAQPRPAGAQSQQPDVDALQSQVEAGRATAAQFALSKQEAAPQSPPLAAQLGRAVNEQVAAGTREFVLKLEPESLGEITVKLVEKAGKTTLQLTAASAQTTRLLNSELPALREALKPMQVEVREAVAQTHASQEHGAAAGFDMAGQQFAGQHGAFAWHAPNPNHGGASETPFSSLLFPEEEAAAEAVRAPASVRPGFDTYI